MAGKLLSLDEAAHRLGISLDEIQRLVDRKQLYPVRDGSTLKFKHDEIERHAAEANPAPDDNSGISLELDIEPQSPEQSGGLEIDLGDGLEIDTAASGAATGSAGPPAAADAAPADGIPLGNDLALDDDNVGDDSIVAGPQASGPAEPAPAPRGGASTGEPHTGTLPFDLSGIEMSAVGGASGTNATGSLVGASDAASLDLSGMRSNVGSALSGVMEGGVSLEDSDIRKSGILSGDDFAKDMESAIKASGPAASGLAGEEMDVFEPVAEDEEGGSDVVAEESGTAGSSFLGEDESESFSLGDGSSDLSRAVGMEEEPRGVGALVPDTSFSVWQVCGLVCCALLMLTGGFLMFDLIRTLGSPEDLSLSSPLLGPMSELFGWRR